MKALMILAALLLVTPVFADLTGNSSISPRFVDTGVINQTFVYTIIPMNESRINSTVIQAPQNYSIVAVQDVTLGALNTSCTQLASCPAEANSTRIIVNFTDPVNNTVNSPIRVVFLVNTSSTSQTGNFTSYLNNSVFHNITNASSVNATQVVTQQMIVSNVTMTKGTAILNGTDYWEFKFDLGLTATQAGLIQFKMNDWIDATGQRVFINTSATDSYASFRNETISNGTGRFNVTASYNLGLNKSSTTIENFYLKMVLPTGSPLSSTWSTTYNFLFRAYP